MTSRAVSFWLNPQELCFKSAQELPPSADVVVIGSSITFGGMRWQSPTKEVGIEDDSTLEPLVGEGLKTFLRDRFASLREVAIDYEWSGIMGFTADENPFIGELPCRPGEYISAGYTGHGMPVALAAGKAIAEQISGSAPAPIPKPFRPERFLLG